MAILPARKQEERRDISPIKLELVITVVEKAKTGFYADLIQSYDSNFQLIMQAKGTADAKILRYLGLTDFEQRAIFSVVRADRTDELMEALEKRFRTVTGGKGIAITVPFDSMIGKLAFEFLTADENKLAEVR